MLLGMSSREQGLLTLCLAEVHSSQHARNSRHFMGLKASSIAPICFIKMDEAGELKVAAEEVGFVPETSLPNRWPHNAVLERE